MWVLKDRLTLYHSHLGSLIQPPLGNYCIEQKLRSVINAHQLPLGTSDTGKDWCIKALHPSDPATSVQGIPDQSSFPSVFMNYQTAQNVYAPGGTTDTWGVDMALLPHPIAFSAFKCFDSTGALKYYGNHSNTQIGAPTDTMFTKMTNWLGTAQRWRIAYASVTIYQDASALTNQGTVAACQYPVSARLFSYCNGPWSPGVMDAHFTTPEYYALGTSFNPGDKPDFEVAQNMPSSYLGNSRDGIYMPLKLTSTCQKWRSEADCYVNLGMQANPMMVHGMTRVGPPYAPGFDEAPDRWPYWAPVAGDIGMAIPEMNDVTLTDAYPSVPAGTGITGHVITRYPTNDMTITSEFCNDVLGSICFRNLDKTTRLSCFYRFGFELQVQPGTLLTPQQHLSPVSDEQALAAYFRISREMKDAYPEDHNSLGKIWDVISRIGKTVLPILAPMIGIPPGSVTSGISLMSRAIRGIESGRNPPAPGDVAIAQKAIKSASRAKTPVKRKGGPAKSRKTKRD